MYICTNCEKCFERKRDYERHSARKTKCVKKFKKELEGGKDINKCTYCMKSFSTLTH